MVLDLAGPGLTWTESDWIGLDWIGLYGIGSGRLHIFSTNTLFTFWSSSGEEISQV